jgi:hypothetical protein
MTEKLWWCCTAPYGKHDPTCENADPPPVRSEQLLSDEFGTFEEFIGQCDGLAQDIANKNPFGALGDGKRMKLLVAIAREWHQAKQEETR